MKIYRILTIAAVLLLTTHLQAQVTIGGVTEPAKGALLDLNSTSKGGLLLSNVSITDLGKIPVGADIFSGITAGGAADANDETNLKLAGTVVYNTNPDTGIGLYIWDGENWNKIGAGGKLILSADAGEVTDTFVAEGTDIKSYTSSDPSSALPGIFTFVWIAGENYIENLSITDAGAGKFSVKFWANDRASSRQAVLLITSPGGNSASFVFTQLGDETGCNPDTPAPVIKAENDRFNICSAGAVYLYLDGNPTGSYVWTLNDEEVGWGTKYVATKPGRYIVYANKIGCTAPAPGTAQVSVNVTVAPSSVSIVATGNNGFLCDVGGTVQLFASQATGVVWYKDGVRQADKTGSPIDAGLGVWFAVVEDGDCSSTSSNSVIVQIDPNAGASAITPFNFSVNGVSGLTDIELCSGGSLNLAVIAPQAGVTYTWYNNNITIGIGDAINYNMEGITGDFVLRCRATKSAACSVESLKQANINAGTAPAKPSISGSSGATLCNGTATLNANGSAGATSYIWYAGVDGNNLAKIAGQTAQSYEIVATGYYKVQAVNGNCVSEESNVYRIETTSGTANVTITGTQTANIGETKTYTAVSDNPLGATFTWTATGDADPTPANGTGAYFGVKFNAVGTASISLTATNACGTSIITNNDYMVTVAPNCIPTTIVSYSPISKSVTKTQTSGGTTALGITASGSPVLTYQWYGNGTPIGGATSATYNAPISATGTVNYYCIVSSSCAPNPDATKTSDVFAVTVNPDPATLAIGSGTLTGKNCFDIVASNFGDACGLQTSRISSKADFTQIATYQQNYTFTATSTGSNLRFVVIDADECVDTYSGAGITGSFTAGATSILQINYKQDLNTSTYPQIVGRTTNSAAQVKVYAVFNSGGTDVAVPLTVKIQDCACCIGFLAENGAFKTNISGTTANSTGAGGVVTAATALGQTVSTGSLCWAPGAGTGSNTVAWNTFCDSQSGKSGQGTDGNTGWRLPTAGEFAWMYQHYGTGTALPANSLYESFKPRTNTGGYISSNKSLQSSNTLQGRWLNDNGGWQTANVNFATNFLRCVRDM